MDEAELERKKARKRKHVRTFYDRLKIVEEVENNPNEKRVTIAKRLGLSASTLNSIFARKKELREQIQIWGNSCRRKSGKSSTFAELESVLFNWYQDSMTSNHRIDGNGLKEKAKIIANDMGLDNFTASNGWVSRFKERHGLTMRKPAIDNSVTEDQLGEVRGQKPVAWIGSLLSPLEGYEPRDVYSADETGLFFNLLPDRVSSFQGEICLNGKHSKDRLTVLLCVNSDGSDKQVPIVVGKYLKPRCFKTVTEFPTIYHANPNAWMTTKIFYSFLYSLDEQMVRENRQIVLFLNERSSHHTTETPFLRNVKVVHRSDKCTPFDSGILHSFKAHYRKSLLKLMQATHRKIELSEALQYILTAWREVSQKSIQNCFRKSAFKFQSDDKELFNGDDDDDDSLFAWEEQCKAENYDFQSYVSVDRDVITSGVEVDEELSGMFESAKNADYDDNDDEDGIYKDDDDDEQKPSFTEVYDALQKIKEFFFLHDGSDKDFENILNLEKSYFHLRHNSTKKMTMKAVEELMKEAKKGKELSERIGIDGWKKSHVRVNKRFLTATITNTISNNNRMKRTKRSQSPQRSPTKDTSKTEKKDLKRSNAEPNERSSPKKRKSTRPQRFDS